MSVVKKSYKQKIWGISLSSNDLCHFECYYFSEDKGTVNTKSITKKGIEKNILYLVAYKLC